MQEINSSCVYWFKDTIEILLDIEESTISEISQKIINTEVNIHYLVKIIAIVAFSRPHRVREIVKLLVALSQRDGFTKIFEIIENETHTILLTKAHYLMIELMAQELIKDQSDEEIADFFRVPVDIIKYKISEAIISDNVYELQRLLHDLGDIENYNIRCFEFGGVFEYGGTNLLNYSIFYNARKCTSYLIELNIFQNNQSIDFAVAGGNIDYLVKACDVIPYKKKHYYYAIMYHQNILVDDIEERMLQDSCFYVPQEEILEFKVFNFYICDTLSQQEESELIKVISDLDCFNEYELYLEQSGNDDDYIECESYDKDQEYVENYKNKCTRKRPPRKQANSRLANINQFVNIETVSYSEEISESVNAAELSTPITNVPNRLNQNISLENDIESEIESGKNPDKATISNTFCYNEIDNPISLIGKSFSDEETLNSAISYSYRNFNAQLMKKSALCDDATIVKCCKCNHCKAVVSAQFNGTAWEVRKAENHTCTPYGYGVANDTLDDIIRNESKRKTLGAEYFNKIRSAAHDNSIPDQRIRRRYQYVFQENCNFRQESWKKLPNLVEEVIRSGGKASIEYNSDNESIKFVGMSPPYAQKYIDSDACFPVLISDGAFLYGKARGDLVAIVSLSGERTIIPLAWGWGEGETEFVCSNVFKLINHDRIETFMSDAGTALNSATKKLGNVFLQICAYHIAASLPVVHRNVFWDLIKAKSKRDYNTIKNRIQTKYPTLHDKLEGKYSLLSIYEDDKYHTGFTIPRHKLKTSGPIESFNHMIQPFRKEEPFELFKHIYHFGLNAIHDLLAKSTGKITDWATKKIKKELELLDEINILSVDGIFVTMDDQSCINRFIVNSDTMCCTCKLREDAGLPCRHLLKYSYSNMNGKFGHLIDKSYQVEYITNAFAGYSNQYIDFESIIPNTEAQPPKTYSLSMQTKRKIMNIDYMKRYKPKK